VCSCLPNYEGSPPGCRPECVLNAECPSNLACINQKCKNPCENRCAQNANCKVLNHIPLCSCTPGNTGDPFSYCHVIPPPPPQQIEPIYTNPCIPSPCGAYAICQDHSGSPSCSCLAQYVGNPPNCRPECIMHSECPSNEACIREKCQDPCPGSCGWGAQCNVINHTPTCICPDGYEGDPFTKCDIKKPGMKYYL